MKKNFGKKKYIFILKIQIFKQEIWTQHERYKETNGGWPKAYPV